MLARRSFFTQVVKWREISAVLALLCIGVGMRSYQIDYNFDLDEVFSVELAGKPFGEVIAQSLKDRPHPPLYNILLHGWISLFGPSETSARLLSVTFSAVFLLLAYLLFRRVTGPRNALGSLALLALSPFLIYYGQQARPYALIGLLATANMLAFVVVMEAPESKRRLLFWAASCAVLLHAQYLGGLLIVLEIAYAAICVKENRFKILLYGLGAMALIGPWLMAAMYDTLFQGTDPLPHISWMTRPRPKDFVWFFLSVFGSISGIASSWLLGVLVVAGSWYLYRAVRVGKTGLKESFLLLVAFGIPFIFYVLSILGPKPIFEERQMITAAIVFAGVVGLFASSLRKGWDLAFFAILIAWTVVAAPEGFPQANKPAWRQAANEINQRYGQENVIVLEPWARGPLQFYRGGGVKLWDGLSPVEKVHPFLLLCRPFQESCPELDHGGYQRRLLATWGNQLQNRHFFELDLFEVVPNAQASLR